VAVAPRSRLGSTVVLRSLLLRRETAAQPAPAAARALSVARQLSVTSPVWQFVDAQG
jgi:hypothetical protein